MNRILLHMVTLHLGRLGRAGRYRAMLALLVLLLAGCGQPEIQPLVFNAAPWQPNEVSTYRVTDINGNYAGTARYDLMQVEDDLWNLRRETNTQGTQEIVTVEMTQMGLRPTQSSLVRIANNGTEMVSATYDGGEVNLELTTRLNITTYERVNVPSDVREQVALVMLLRALPLMEGYAVHLNVFQPILGTFERVTLSVEGGEQVTTEAGAFETWLVQMATPTSETQAWVATEAPYPVIKFIDSRNGGIFELSEFQAEP